MRSSGTRARRHLAVAGVLCVLLAGGCSKSASSGTSAATTAGTAAATGAATAACALLTKAEVAQATGQSIAFSKQASLGSVSTCTFGSLSGFAVVLDHEFADGRAELRHPGTRESGFQVPSHARVRYR